MFWQLASHILTLRMHWARPPQNHGFGMLTEVHILMTEYVLMRMD